jgi:hypothetical protein
VGKKYPNTTKPVLLIGENKYEKGDPFEINHPKNPKKDGGLFGGGNPFAPPPPPRIKEPVSEWLEFEFHYPDGMITKTKLEIFDRLGFAARKKGSDQFIKEEVEEDHPLFKVFCLSFYTGPLNARNIINEKADQTEQTVTNQTTLSIEEVTNVLTDLNHGVSILSDTFADSFVAGHPAHFSSASPRLIISSLHTTEEKTQLTIDLRHSDFFPITKKKNFSKLFLFRVLRGVVDGVIEEALGGTLFRENIKNNEIFSSYSTVHVFHNNAEEGTSLLLQGKPVERQPAFPALAMARIKDNLAGGNLVIAPEKTVKVNGQNRAAWWRIDKATGETVAINLEGLHAATVEYQVTKNKDGTYTVRIFAPKSNVVVNTHGPLNLSEYIDLMRSLIVNGLKARPMLP